MLLCKACGNNSTFRRFSTVTEICLVNANQEFIKVIDADTDDVWAIECNGCGSSNLGEDS